MGEDGIDESFLYTHSTEHICADCSESIRYMDEVYLLQVVRPVKFGKEVQYCQVIDEAAAAGEFLFEPWFYCIPCWEKLYESVRSDMSDELPVTDEHSDLECSCCASGMRSGNIHREGELVGIATMGEFRLSTRAPNGMHGPEFTPISNPDTLCLYCLTIINDGYIDMWPNLSERGECADCIQMRCWREQQCACQCHLNLQEEEEEEEEEQPVVPIVFT